MPTSQNSNIFVARHVARQADFQIEIDYFEEDKATLMPKAINTTPINLSA